MTIESLRWVQIPRQPGSKQRDPIQGEFFNTDSLTTLAKQVTREGIGQNPLDAFEDYPVRVRVYVSGESGALSQEVASTYFRGLREHVAECDREASKLFDEPCPFIVVEDFNTTGLLGDPGAIDEPPEGEANDFFYFFRAEGKSGKSGADRGRWGVGKYVFPMASQINTFFGLTIRGDESEPGGNGPLLIGQTVLKNHSLGPDGRYEPDGWWAIFNDEDVPLPITDSEIVDRFTSDWSLSRRTEPGLSVVVPYIHDDLGAEDLISAIIVDYHLAILSGKLVAEVASPEDPAGIRIDADSLRGALSHISDAEVRAELGAQIDLAEWYLGLSADQVVDVARIESGAPGWEPDLLADEVREKLRSALADGERIAVRVPVEVSKKTDPPVTSWSYFDIVMEGEEGFKGKPVFVREGLIVPEVPTPSLSGVRCFVTVDDKELARMVGDAEGPAHTNWSPRTAKFSGKYGYGREWLSFIKKAPAELLRLIREDDEAPDRRFLSRFFPAPPRNVDPGPGPGPEPPDPPESQPKRIRVGSIEGGFSMNLTPAGRGVVKRIAVRVAYDRRKGSPFKNWRKEDFQLGEAPVEIDVSGGTLQSRNGNRLVANVDDPDAFRVHVTGFDTNRDLIVDPSVEVNDAAD